jgi:hypothetical protein
MLKYLDIEILLSRDGLRLALLAEGVIGREYWQ